ncbi:MAG: hypothetical protein ACREXS_15925 [Gammaproteobacteria bacterium]
MSEVQLFACKFYQALCNPYRGERALSSLYFRLVALVVMTGLIGLSRRRPNSD